MLFRSNSTYWAFRARPWDMSTQRARAPRLLVTTNQFNTTYTNNFGFAARVKVLLVLTNTATDSAIVSLQTTGGTIIDTASCPSTGTVATNEMSIDMIANVEDTWSITNRIFFQAEDGIRRVIIVND